MVKYAEIHLVQSESFGEIFVRKRQHEGALLSPEELAHAANEFPSELPLETEPALPFEDAPDLTVEPEPDAVLAGDVSEEL